MSKKVRIVWPTDRDFKELLDPAELCPVPMLKRRWPRSKARITQGLTTKLCSRRITLRTRMISVDKHMW